MAATAEQAGAAGLWACDHLFWHRPALDPLAALAVAATTSSTAVLGTSILQLPLRNPAAVARQAATLQILAEGRFVLGLGVGSHQGEYEASGVDYSRRGRLLDQGIEALRAAWATAGRADLRYRQDPPVPRIPLWVAGSSEAALARVARAGDGWVPLFIPPAQYAATRRRLLDLALECGRDPDVLETSVVVMLSTGDNPEVARKEGALWLSDLYDLPPRAFERHLVAGSPDDCAAAVASYQEAGAGHVIVMVAADDTLEHFSALADALGSADQSSHTPAIRSERLGATP